VADILLTRGTTASITVNCSKGGSVYALTGIQALVFTAKRTKDDTDAIILKAIGSGVTVTDAANGTAVIVIDPSDTASLSGNPDVLYYSLLVQDATDNIFELNSGQMTVLAPVGSIASTTVRRMVAVADSMAANWSDAVTMSLVPALSGGDSLDSPWRDSIMLVTESAIILEEPTLGPMADGLEIGYGLAMADSFSLSDAVSVALS
jgi:hypothetical protein